MAKADRRGGENARAELERLGRAGETLGGTAIERTTEISDGDRIEIWGRRIGRMLGWAFAIFLVIQLFRTFAP
jgi:hypothetical protein